MRDDPTWFFFQAFVTTVFITIVFTIIFAIASQGKSERFDATLVRADIGHALTCWTTDGTDIFCQEVITP